MASNTISVRALLSVTLSAFAVVCAVAILAPASAAARPLYGVQGVSGGGDAARTVADVGAAARAGLDVVRVQAFWAALEPRASGERDPEALAALDRVVGEATRRRLKVVLFVVGTPCWDSTAPAADRGDCSDPAKPSVYRYQPRRTQPFVDVSTFLVGRYRDALAAYEIWNEPDQANELYWAGPDKAANYTRLVKAAYAPLKAVAPRVPVLAGSFVGINGAWLNAMYDNGLKGNYDALSVHFYSVPLYGLSNTRAVQRRHGDTKPLWLAEYGFSSCYEPGGPARRGPHRCVTTAQQARNISDLVNAVSRTSYVKAAILYTFRDESRGYRFGLVDARGALKPAYATLKRELAGSLRAAPRQRVRLTRSGDRLVVSGSASSIEVLELRVRQGNVLRYRATLVADRFGRFRVVLPAAIGTRGVSASVRGSWTRRTTTARR